MLRLEAPACAGRIASFLLVVMAFLPIPVLAQWQPGGVPVCGDCDGTIEDVFRAIPDGEGGVFVAWRRYLPEGSDLYLQRLTRDGVRAPGWPLSGVPLVTAAGHQDIQELVSDSAGGVYAFWSDYRNIGTAYCIRVLANGTPAPGWPVNGRVVGNANSSQEGPRGCVDGQGGVIVAWTDYRDGDYGTDSNPDVYGVRLLADGIVAPGWSEGGVPLAADSAAYERMFSVTSDGAGGAYVEIHVGNPQSIMHVLRMNGAGAPDSQWPIGGAIAANIRRSGPSDACSDGSGGLFLAWSDVRGYGGIPPIFPYRDVYATYLLPDGSFAPGWGVNGLPIATKPGGETNVQVSEDGFGHFLVTWNDYSSGQGASRATRILRDGTLAPGWPAEGALVTTGPGVEFQSNICADGTGGAFVAVESWEDVQFVIAQRFTATGQLAPGWTPEGLKLWPVPGDQGDAVVVPSDPGSAIVVWYDSRGLGNIYAQRLIPDGVVATSLSLVSAEVSPEAIHIVGHAPGPAGGSVALERRCTAEPWQVIASLTTTANGRVEIVDRDVHPGERLGYRLAQGAGESRRYSSEVWVEVPLGTSFALAGFRPNPSPPRPTVEFSVATSDPVRLEVFDPAGRRRHALEIESPAPGPHTLTLPVVLDPGLYWLRLAQGSRVTRRTAVVVR